MKNAIACHRAMVMNFITICPAKNYFKKDYLSEMVRNLFIL
jgi:hypothetical protein